MCPDGEEAANDLIAAPGDRDNRLSTTSAVIVSATGVDLGEVTSRKMSPACGRPTRRPYRPGVLRELRRAGAPSQLSSQSTVVTRGAPPARSGANAASMSPTSPRPRPSRASASASSACRSGRGQATTAAQSPVDPAGGLTAGERLSMCLILAVLMRAHQGGQVRAVRFRTHRGYERKTQDPKCGRPGSVHPLQWWRGPSQRG